MKTKFLPLLLLTTPAFAEVVLPPIISDNMVLQQPTAAIWGKADPGEKVTVTLGAKPVETTANAQGQWRVELGDLKPGVAGTMTVAGANNRLEVKNVAVGDVWFASGQSNMAWTMNQCRLKDDIAAAKHPGLRMFKVKKQGSETVLPEVEGEWTVATPTSVGAWSAVGYFFGREIAQTQKIPVGVIDSSVGGTNARSWVSREVLAADPEQQKSLKTWAERLEQYPARKEAYDKARAQWKLDAEAAKAEGKPAPKAPNVPSGPNNVHGPGNLYNAMVSGVLPYAIKGAIWYQGESNAQQSSHYFALMEGLITSWRKAWGAEFPFYIVQLANFKERKEQPVESGWAALREAQRKLAREIPSSGLAVAIDVGEAEDIHPKNKLDVGKRLALLARAGAYGETGLVSSGPALREVRFADDVVKVTFEPGTAAGLKTSDGEPPKSFALAGEDGVFHWAATSIEKDGVEEIVTLRCKEVPSPTRVRYAYADNPEVNLVNEVGLPAVPFDVRKP